MRSRGTTILLVLIAFFWFGGRTIVELLIDWNWFTALEHVELFFTRLQTQAILAILFFSTSAIFIGLNIRYALKSKPIPLHVVKEQLVEGAFKEEQLQSLMKLVLWAVIILPSLLLATVAAQQWLYALAFFDSVPFDSTDPIFSNDISFYTFELPIIRFAVGSSVSICILTMLITGALVALRDIFLGQGAVQLHKKAIQQLFVLAGILFLLFGISWYLDRYDLLFSKSGAVWGMGYTDINAREPAFYAMAILSVLTAVLLFASSRSLKMRLPVTAIVIYVAARVLLTSAWPSMIQTLMVEPSELEKETQYLEHNIQFSREAYALNRISENPFEVESELSMDSIESNPLTINNIRVWDDRPLLTTYGQIQEIRTYYDFRDVDVDRYVIDGQLRQVMLSARELNYDNFNAEGRSWVNEHFQYTHGHGLTMSPVNVVTEEGLPDLFIKDIPPQSTDAVKNDIQITRPEIYYGEKTDRYIVVMGGIEEFDYPKGNDNVLTKYSGKGGVSIDSFFKRALFWLYFNDIELLFSQYITPESRVLFHRSIRERVQKLAPFLYFDRDPYLVINDEGKLVWILDAYTITDNYPYSEPVSTTQYRYNYIRNSVKVMVDAYDGRVDFYIADLSDPLIKVYNKVFPNTFKSQEDMPKSMKEHLRYPVDFFNIQAKMFSSYHMKRPNVFYNKEDVWDTPKELYDGKEQRMQSYYLIMKLPGEEKAEFVLLLPFVPTQKSNMIAWLAARSDGENYGNLLLYQFPKQKLIYGPLQIEARIDQDPKISQQITLWSQSGSRVVRGNLLVIPIEDSLVYVEPLYLQAESSQLPELKRVIVSYDKKISMKQNLSAALMDIFNVEQKTLSDLERTVAESETSLEVIGSGDWKELAQQALASFERAQQKQREGDWSGYGSELKSLSEMLQNLEAISRTESTMDSPKDASESEATTLPSAE